MSRANKEVQLTEIQKLINEQKESGLSIKSFCVQKNISIGRWNYYRLLLKKENGLEHKISPVKVINKPLNEVSDIKLALPNGFQLALPLTIEASRVKQLVEVLLSC